MREKVPESLFPQSAFRVSPRIRSVLQEGLQNANDRERDFRKGLNGILGSLLSLFTEFSALRVFQGTEENRIRLCEVDGREGLRGASATCAAQSLVHVTADLPGGSAQELRVARGDVAHRVAQKEPQSGHRGRRVRVQQHLENRLLVQLEGVCGCRQQHEH